jgi:hypothetical protein
MDQIAQGDGQMHRDGCVIYMERLLLNGVLAIGDETNIVRIIVYVTNSEGDSEINITTKDLDWLAYPMLYPSLHSVLADQYFLLEASYTQQVITLDIPLGYLVTYRQGSNDCDPRLWLAVCSDSAAIAHPGFVAGNVTTFWRDVP